MQNRGKSIPGGGKNEFKAPRQGKKRKGGPGSAEGREGRPEGLGRMAQDNLLVAGGGLRQGGCDLIEKWRDSSPGLPCAEWTETPQSGCWGACEDVGPGWRQMARVG